MRTVGEADCRHAVREARERHAMKRTVGEADCSHAVGEARGEACHEEDCRRGRLQAFCRRGKGRGMP
jgi:hypothetical protein